MEDGFFLYPVLPIQHLSHPAEIQSVDHAVRMQVSLCRLRLGQRLAAEQMPKQYTNLLDWMSALVDQFAAAAVK